MKNNIMNIVAGVGAVLAMISAVIAADARYTKQSDLQDIKDEIINEMRREVTINRAGMIGNMQRDADDIEYQILEFDRQGKTAPRYMVEKQKLITRQIADLKEKTIKPKPKANESP